MNSIRDLVREAHACGVNAFLGVPQVTLLLRDVNVTGLRTRTYHRHGHCFVRLFLDNRQVLQTEISLEPTTPSWSLAPYKVLSVYPSSILRFCVFRNHRHTLTEELVGQVEGTVWTFLSEAHLPVDSQDSPNLSIAPNLSLDTPEDLHVRQKAEDVDVIEIERHRIEILNKQRAARKKSGFVRVVLPGLIDAVLGDMDGLLNILDHIAPAIPLSKIVVVLLRVVHGMVKAHGQVDTDIEELFKTLRETLLQAAQCEGNDVKQQAVKLVGSSVAIVDGWVHERSGKQLIKATYTQQRIRTFQAQLVEFNLTLKPKLEASPIGKFPLQAEDTSPSLAALRRQSVPEMERSVLASPPDSPGPGTPPVTRFELESISNKAERAQGPLTCMLKDVEEHRVTLHHVSEQGVLEGVEARGVVGVVDGVV